MENKSGAQPAKLKRLNAKELALFSTQISIFLQAGINLIEGLTLLQEDLPAGPMRQALAQVSTHVEQRVPLADAMERCGAFPMYIIRMARIGETAGTLDQTMEAVAKYYEREQALKERIRSAVTYPLMMLLMMTAIVFLLIVQVLPMFDQLLQSLGGEMPGFVRGLMRFGSFLGRNIIPIAIVLVVLAACFLIFRRTRGGRRILDRIKASSPFTRKLYAKIGTERFSASMSYLLHANIDLETSLSLVRDVVGNDYFSHRMDDCLQRIHDGSSFVDAVYQAGIFPKLFTRMLSIGFKTGRIDEMMLRLSQDYEKQVDESLDRVTGSIEPIFVTLLSVIVGIILISVMLPLIQIMSSIG